jgi:hypothetical protein
MSGEKVHLIGNLCFQVFIFSFIPHIGIKVKKLLSTSLLFLDICIKQKLVVKNAEKDKKDYFVVQKKQCLS